jgi:hypothetical protein
MSAQMGTQEAQITADDRPAVGATADGGLPEVAADASADQIVERLSLASRRGRLPGFEARPTSDRLFAVAAHGHPFDGVLTAEHRAEVGRSRLRFRLMLHRKMPVIFAVAMLLTIWPGVYFMDELIAQFAPGWWRPWVTYYWYLPLTILPIPWLWASLMKRSRASIHAAVIEAIGRIAKEIGGDIV